MAVEAYVSEGEVFVNIEYSHHWHGESGLAASTYASMEVKADMGTDLSDSD